MRRRIETDSFRSVDREEFADLDQAVKAERFEVFQNLELGAAWDLTGEGATLARVRKSGGELLPMSIQTKESELQLSAEDKQTIQIVEQEQSIGKFVSTGFRRWETSGEVPSFTFQPGWLSGGFYISEPDGRSLDLVLRKKHIFSDEWANPPLMIKRRRSVEPLVLLLGSALALIESLSTDSIVPGADG